MSRLFSKREREGCCSLLFSLLLVHLSGPSGCFFLFYFSSPIFSDNKEKIFFFSSSKVLGKLRGPQRATAPAQAGVVPTGAGAGASPFFTFYFSVFFFFFFFFLCCTVFFSRR